MEMRFKVGDIASFKGSDSWGIITEIMEGMLGEPETYITPLCGTHRWMNPPKGHWSVLMTDLQDIPPKYTELTEILYGG